MHPVPQYDRQHNRDLHWQSRSIFVGNKNAIFWFFARKYHTSLTYMNLAFLYIKCSITSVLSVTQFNSGGNKS